MKKGEAVDKRPTGLVFFPAFDWAISPTHPEREERLLYTRDQLFEEGLMDLPQIREYQPRLAGVEDIARVHFCVPNVESQATEAHGLPPEGFNYRRRANERRDKKRFCPSASTGTPCHAGGSRKPGIL